jgi:hypothetical protein
MLYFSITRIHWAFTSRRPGNLNNNIGLVTAKWKETGVYIAVTNVASWFDYGKDDNALRQVFLTRLRDKDQDSPASAVEDNIRTASPGDLQGPARPMFKAKELTGKVKEYSSSDIFRHAQLITNETFALVLRRIGDKNVFPYVHVMLCFLSSFASSTYVSDLLNGTPWFELAAFLNTLVKTEIQLQSQLQNQTQNLNTLLAGDVFPAAGEKGDELPLPEDYLVRGFIWA